MKTTLSASPAYGRDYKSKAAVLEDFNNGREFLGYSMIARFSGYFSSRDVDALKKDFDAIEFRYAKHTKAFIHKL